MRPKPHATPFPLPTAPGHRTAPVAPALLALLALGSLGALGACHDSNNSTPAVTPATNNLKAGTVVVASDSPRVGHPLDVVTSIESVETAVDVTVSFYVQNGQDVAQLRDPIRQFYVGSATFASVQPAVTEYRAQLIVPASVTPPGDYVLLASIDPSDLVRETNEKDNLAEVQTTLAPLEDPNVVLREVALDRQSILLDADFDDVPGTQQNDVQNSDLGASLAIELEGTLTPADVEAYVRLRITRTDLPPGADTHDVPLYLWNSDEQRYIDVFGINGPAEWLPLGSVVPLAASETETAIDIKETGARSAYLDVYLPGKLASEMITILEHLVQGPPPTVPPPDLRLEDILALRAFFTGASLSHVRFAIVVDVRPIAGQLVETNLADNTISQPMYLILPGQESQSPDRPLAWEQGHEDRWGSDKFGVGFAFDSFAAIDRRGAVAEVRGAVTAEVFGNSFEFMGFDARAQVVPAVDPAATAGENSGFNLDIEFASITVYSYQRELGYVFDGSFSVSKEKSFTKQFFVGPVPVSTTGGVAGEIGYQLVANLQPASLASTTGPYAKLEASIEAGVGIPGFRAGAGGTLTLIDERFEGSVQTGLTVVSASAPAIFEGNAAMQVANTLTGPTGRLYLFVEYPGIKWCRACIFGVCLPFPCGFKTVRKEFGLVTWVSFVKEDVLFDEVLCKRVILGPTTTFGFCLP